MEQLEAGILGTVFRNDENGWSVITVRAGRNEVTVVGTLPELSPGEQAVFTGEWIEHKTYGRQFKCTSCEIRVPTTLLGIERYLAGGLIRGVGPATALLIVRQFGEETMSVLSEHPERLTEIPGIGPKRCQMIAESFREHQSVRRAMVFLQSYGIPANLAVKISKYYGDQTPDIIRQDPYRLCDDIDGVGFKTADRIGIALGVAPDSESRIRCALRYMLRDSAVSSGHVYLPEKELCSAATALLQIPGELCAKALRSLLVSGSLIGEAGEETDNRRIYLPAFWHAEQEVALRIRELMCAVRADKFAGAARAISAFEKNHGISPVTGTAEDVVIVLHEQELPPAVSIGGNTKEKYLVRPGVKVNERIGGADFYRPGDGKGAELGCIAKVRKPFLIKDIQFTILDNHIPGCVASVNVYRIEGDPETFINVLHKPIYVNILESDSRQDYSIQPEETVLLEPGKYFVALQIVAADNEAVRKILETPESERHPRALHMSTALYFKSSYERYAAMGKMIKIPVNIGVGVKGLEYQ